MNNALLLCFSPKPIDGNCKGTSPPSILKAACKCSVESIMDEINRVTLPWYIHCFSSDRLDFSHFPKPFLGSTWDWPLACFVSKSSVWETGSKFVSQNSRTVQLFVTTGATSKGEKRLFASPNRWLVDRRTVIGLAKLSSAKKFCSTELLLPFTYETNQNLLICGRRRRLILSPLLLGDLWMHAGKT